MSDMTRDAAERSDIGGRIMDLIPDTVPSGTTAWQACVAAATLAREAVAELRAENTRLKQLLADTPGALDLANSTLGQCITRRNAELLAENERLREACKAAMPWVAIATSDHDPHRHPKSVQNAKDDLKQLQAALGKRGMG
jgi:hypothetical protein